MTIKAKRTGLPPEAEAAIAAHAAAMVAGDDRGAAKFGGALTPASTTALERAAAMRPFSGYVVIARARLGFQYLVKLRLTAAAGELDLQMRWHRIESGDWQIVEIDDLGSQSPWKKPVRVATPEA
jgi:hypothetical protein